MKEYVLEKVKVYVTNQLESAEKYCVDSDEVLNMRGVAFGAVNFVIDLYPEVHEELNAWWEDIWNKFYDLQMRVS